MNLQVLNRLLQEIDQKPDREKMFELSLALLELLGLEMAEIGKPRLLATDFMTLHRKLVPAPVTGQAQLYRLTANGQNMHVRLAVLEKFDKKIINLLVDKDPGLATWQASMRGIVQPPGSEPWISPEPYFLHFVTTGSYKELLVVVSNGEQKRVVNFRRRLTVTQHNRVLRDWENIAKKSKPEIAEIFWKSLDIKEVNREFYKRIKECYDSLLGIVQRQQPHLPGEDVKQFAVRLIGRYLFSWFLKEKGVVPEKLLISDTIARNRENFYQKHLHRLFFQTLNEEVSNRNIFEGFGELEPYYHNIPYLNGGLFEKHPEDEFWNLLDLNDWLLSFVKVLEEFDFTVDESSAGYQQVAIDPEMLGRIFENLLASQNKETEKLANQRNAFGAFYTPREIVEYMVNESIKAYLESHLLSDTETEKAPEMVNEPLYAFPGSLFAEHESRQILMNLNPMTQEEEKTRKRIQNKIEKLFTPDCADNPFDKEETQIVRRVLSEITILDPACGSGAFPMGAMLRLMELRQIVGHGHRSSYDLKHEILSKNIFGVDIMPMAVEIARLRAWLSLVLETEYKSNERKNNFGISALPNLDFKFVCANSLIYIEEDHYLRTQASDELKRFGDLTAQYYRVYDLEKEQVKTEIEACINAITDVHRKAIKSQEDQIVKEDKRGGHGNRLKGLKDHHAHNQQQLELWESYKNLFSSKPVGFFNIKYFFPMVHEGFDVVIGNPPYLRIQGVQEATPELVPYAQKNYVSAGKGNWDLYVLFTEAGYKMLVTNGILAFIQPHKFFQGDFGMGIRNYIANNKCLFHIVHFGAEQMFESATNYTCLIFLQKQIRQAFTYIKSDNPEAWLKDTSSVPANILPQPLIDQKWVFASEEKKRILEKLQVSHQKISDITQKIFQGIPTGADKVFILQFIGQESTGKLRCYSNALEKEITIERDFVKPFLMGKDVKRYTLPSASNYVLFPYKNVASKCVLYDASEIESRFPLAWSYLLENFETLIKRENNKFEKTWWQYSRPQNLDEFETIKILTPDIANQGNFSIDHGNNYHTTTVYSFSFKEIEILEKPEYWLGVFNSKLMWFFLQSTGNVLRGGYFRFKTDYLKPFPVKRIDFRDKIEVFIYDMIISNVQQTLENKQRGIDTTAFENRIDELVFKLYDLTYEEVKVIEPDFWLSEGEYERVDKSHEHGCFPD